MLVRPIYQEWELWKWMAIISLAAALCLAFASALGAADRSAADRPPKLLPTEILESATPMPVPNENSSNEDLSRAIWEILELHQLGDHDAAANGWHELNLPEESIVWRSTALGAASLARGEFEDAETFLKRAIDARPDNAIAYYIRAMLRREQAARAWDWPEDFGPRNVRLVATVAPPVVPNTKSMYELAATVDLEKAIELAKTFRFDEPLVPDRFATTMALEPTVRDLLVALHAENFVGNAHVALGSLFLDRGALELAEHHLDAAVQEQVIVRDFRKLGDAYRDRGQDADANRAYRKALNHGGEAKQRP